MKNAARISLVLLALTLAATPATAEETETAALGTRVHAGVGLSIHQAIISDETDLVPQLELGVILGGVVDLYLTVGLDIERESFEDDNRRLTSTAGALMTGLGLRVIIGEPRPKSAFFYAGILAAPVIGIASYSSDGDDGDDAYYEARAREYADRFDVGITLGVEYLVAASFGIGVEAGFVTSINNLEKTNEDAPDKHMRVGFFVPFLVRAAYHF